MASTVPGRPQPYSGRHSNLGRLLSALKQYPEAETAFREALSLDPGDARVHHNLGNVLRDQRR